MQNAYDKRSAALQHIRREEGVEALHVLGIATCALLILLVLVQASERFGSQSSQHITDSIACLTSDGACDAGGEGGNGEVPSDAADAGEENAATEDTDDAENLTAEQIRERAEQRALENAGIDPNAWDPSQGFEANQDIARSVYDYYRDLYQRDPEKYHWALMARVAAEQTFYPNFVLVEFAHDVAAGENIPWYLWPLTKHPAISPLLELPADELWEMEKALVTMQREIFEDLAWQHEAYDEGGIDAMRTLGEGHVLDPETVRAWELIDAGNVVEGNEILLRREQHDVIQDNYDQLTARLNQTVDGQALVEALNLFATAPIPGSHNFTEVVDGGDVVDFDDRWQWIESDMYPALVDLIESGAADEQAQIPLNDSVRDAIIGLGEGVTGVELPDWQMPTIPWPSWP